MASRIPLNLRLDDLSLDRLVDLIHERADRGCASDPEIEGYLVAVYQRIRQALTERFGDRDFVDDAADSALGTLLRRIRAGESLGDGRGTIADFLATIALDKAFACQRRREFNLGPDPADPSPTPADEAMRTESEAERRYLHQLMQQELDNALAEMEPYLENERHRTIFQILFDEAYGGAKRSNTEIAVEARCSVRTVERVRRDFRSLWLPRVTEARRSLRARLETVQ
ncbi:MAG: hypothetical protein ACLQIB_57220 [Isosphaeraceae bacterium]